MELREPGVCRVDVAKGELVGATNRYVKTLADLGGLYEDEAAFRALKEELGSTVVYEVTDFKPSTNPGDMIVGVTRMRAGKVGREFFLTRGHIHANANRPEMYYGESGRGVMLLESPRRRDPHGRDRAAHALLCAAFLDPPLGQRRRRRPRDDLRLSSQLGPGLRDHRGGRRHAKPRRR